MTFAIDLLGHPVPPALAILLKAMPSDIHLASGIGYPDDPRHWLPPEVRLFGRTGVDGGVVGVSLQAPEIVLPTLPIVEYYWDEGTDTLHPTSALGAADFLQSWGKESPNYASLLADIRAAARPEPTLPKGYCMLPTSDGLGVLVPRSSVGPDGEYDDDIALAPDEIRRFMASGFAGQALWIGRQALHHLYCSEGPDERHAAVHLALAEVYEALGRPVYAAVSRSRNEDILIDVGVFEG